MSKFEFGTKYFGTRMFEIDASDWSCDHIDIQCHNVKMVPKHTQKWNIWASKSKTGKKVQIAKKSLPS